MLILFHFLRRFPDLNSAFIFPLPGYRNTIQSYSLKKNTYRGSGILAASPKSPTTAVISSFSSFLLMRTFWKKIHFRKMRHNYASLAENVVIFCLLLHIYKYV
jgi:hypothetical protein